LHIHETVLSNATPIVVEPSPQFRISHQRRDMSLRILGEQNAMTRSEVATEVDRRRGDLQQYLNGFACGDARLVIPKGAANSAETVRAVILADGENLNQEGTSFSLIRRLRDSLAYKTGGRVQTDAIELRAAMFAIRANIDFVHKRRHFHRRLNLEVKARIGIDDESFDQLKIRSQRVTHTLERHMKRANRTSGSVENKLKRAVSTHLRDRTGAGTSPSARRSQRRLPRLAMRLSPSVVDSNEWRPDASGESR
jgi:hypothetical protein